MPKTTQPRKRDQKLFVSVLVVCLSSSCTASRRCAIYGDFKQIESRTTVVGPPPHSIILSQTSPLLTQECVLYEDEVDEAFQKELAAQKQEVQDAQRRAEAVSEKAQ